MACPERLSDVLRASTIRRRHDACATRRRDGMNGGARRRANGHRDVSRSSVACRIAWSTFEADDVAPGEGRS
ncbi:hypothetical protein WT27_03470 [Burkholderia territorii]|uniref:Uncharacterized protein n=1 Tax=Burkholderia territorii TaxID=1503055 RepID=A0A125ABZ6_9BURK|nr:hypothetical protein WT27_03470 [Burkholderia territorii]KVX26590.1 hypothetical protein WT31_16220 [Burkholderia territorii]